MAWRKACICKYKQMAQKVQLWRFCGYSHPHMCRWRWFIRFTAYKHMYIVNVHPPHVHPPHVYPCACVCFLCASSLDVHCGSFSWEFLHVHFAYSTLAGTSQASAQCNAHSLCTYRCTVTNADFRCAASIYLFCNFWQARLCWPLFCSFLKIYDRFLNSNRLDFNEGVHQTFNLFWGTGSLGLLRCCILQ